MQQEQVKQILAVGNSNIVIVQQTIFPFESLNLDTAAPVAGCIASYIQIPNGVVAATTGPRRVITMPHILYFYILC